MKRLVVLLSGVLAVCGVVPVASAPGAAPATAKAAAQKPAATDGQPRVVERRGKFVIRPDTLFCLKQGFVDPALHPAVRKIWGMLDAQSIDNNLKKIGQGRDKNGSWRDVPFDPKNCADNGKNIISEANLKLNNAGQPYRLERRVWQGKRALIEIVTDTPQGVWEKEAVNMRLERAHPHVPAEQRVQTAKWLQNFDRANAMCMKLIVDEIFK